MADQWFILRDDKKYGPYNSAQMRQMASGGQLLPIDMVQEEGTAQWTPASQVQTFFPATGTNAAPPPPLPPPLAPEPAEWHYTKAGAQAGPVPWSQLRQLAASDQLLPTDMVWKAGMPAWAAASTITGLFPPPPSAPPPLPPALVPPTLPAQIANNRVSGELHLDGRGGRSTSTDQVEILLDGKKIGSGSLCDGFHLEFESAVGQHSVKLQQVIALKSNFLGSFGKSAGVDKVFPVKFEKAGHYTVTFKHSQSALAKIGAVFQQSALPAEIEVTHTAQVKEVTLTPVEQGEEVAGGVFTAILGERNKAARRRFLVGLWEPVSGEGLSLIFTEDGGHYRSDGVCKKYSWLSDDKLELHEDGGGATVAYGIVSLGDHELMLKTDQGAAHYKRSRTITEKRQGTQGLIAAWRRSARQKNLIGLWEPVNFTSQWFMFTRDEAMLRGDGLAAKFRWVGDDIIELYAEETPKTVQFSVLSLNEFEMILKVGEQSGHFKKGVSITDEQLQRREAEARKRRAEAAANFAKVAGGVASVLAAGGFAVLCCGAALSGPSRCCCPFPVRYGNVCANCGLSL